MPLSRRQKPPRRRAFAVAVLTAAALLPALGAAAPAAAAPVSLSGAHWVWYPEGSPATEAPAATRYLRRTFTVAAGTVSDAQFVVAGDDTVDVWLNGSYLAGSRRVQHSWRQGLYIDLGGVVKPGANTIAVAVRNTGGPAGTVGRLRVATSGGTVELITDGGWKAAQSVPENWMDPAFNDGGWPAAMDLGSYGISPWMSDVVAPNPNAASPVGVAGLTAERRSEPVGIAAARPRLGWKLTSGEPGQVQAAYQVNVGNSPGTSDVWDSGRVASDRSVDVEYGGPALTSNRSYHWRVRIWDAQGRVTAFSPSARFDTGLFNPAAEWQGDFVGQSSTADLSGASWIWYPEGDPASSAPISTRYFRRTFTISGAVPSARLVVTGDDSADVWVNGVQVSTSPRVYESWKRAAVLDLTSRLVTGTNTIAISSENTTVSPAGMIAKLTLGSSTIVTDGSWKASQTGPSGWQQPGFNDGSWPAARALATYGSGPWASNVSISSGAPYLRKGFTVGKAVSRARLFATALGLHDTFLNGARVGDERLAPGWTDYNKRVQYRVHDVTGAIRQGDNALGAVLGNGWYSGSLGMGGNQRYGTSPWYSAFLVIQFTDGTSSVVRTDGTWRTAPSGITFNDLYHGEDVDARLNIAGFSAPGFNDSAWVTVNVRSGARPNLVAQVDPGVRVQQELRPVSVTQPQPGVFVADMGQNFTGWNRLRVRGTAGTRVTLRHAEVLNPNGTIYTANLRAARQTDSFTLAGTGADEVFEPRFTVHGYRYVEITGFPGTPSVDSITGLAAWTDGASTGEFTTSNALVNQLQHNIVWGSRSNMLSIPTDCPQRDERLGWTGDIAIFAGTSTFNFDTRGLLDKFTDDLVDAQRGDGSFTDVAPDVCCGSGTAGWGDAGVIVPYTLWQRYGDLRAADRAFPAMVRWVDYLRATSGADLIRNRPTYGDWLNVNDNTAQDVISTAFFAWSARLLSRMAAATGRNAEAATYGALADQVGAAFTNRFVAADGTVSGNTQTGYVLALAFGLVPASRMPSLASRLAAKVAERGGHLSVGFLGVENLLPVLAENGHLATAYQILLQPGFPGWGYMNSRGATTIWERWDGIRTDGSFNDPGMNSFNHYGLGAVGDWLYRSVGGMGPAAPGYRKLLIAPRPGGGLSAASASLTTPYGLARSAWSGGGSTLQVVVPPNATATVRVPAPSASAVSAPPEAVPMGYAGGAAVYALPSGTYTFTVA